MSKSTIIFSVATFIIIIAVDVYWNFDGKPGNTISEVARWLGQRYWWTPYVLIVALGGLTQHFYRFDSPLAAIICFVVGMIIAKLAGI